MTVAVKQRSWGAVSEQTWFTSDSDKVVDSYLTVAVVTLAAAEATAVTAAIEATVRELHY